MKRIFLMLAAAVITGSYSSEAKIWRVNSYAGSGAHFNNIAAAITAASPGDTIHVEGSATNYGYLTITKRVVLIGTGYFLDDATPNPKTQFNTAPSSVTNVVFNAGSKGSSISGFNITSVAINDSLITIQRNNITSTITLASTANSDADTIRQNFISAFISASSPSYKCTNLLLYNNILTASSPVIINANMVNNVSGYFINNSFVNSGATLTCANFIFQNNIFSAANFGSYLSANIFYNNIVSNTSLPANNGNLQNVPMTNVYQGWTSGTGFSSDGRYQLKAGSSAIGAGTLNGTTVDCGAFGGPAPYILSGMPSVPSIYSLNAPDQVATGTTSVNVTISAVAH